MKKTMLIVIIIFGMLFVHCENVYAEYMTEEECSYAENSAMCENDDPNVKEINGMDARGAFGVFGCWWDESLNKCRGHESKVGYSDQAVAGDNVAPNFAQDDCSQYSGQGGKYDQRTENDCKNAGCVFDRESALCKAADENNMAVYGNHVKCPTITSTTACENTLICTWTDGKCTYDLSIYKNIQEKNADCEGIFGTFWDDLKYIGNIFRIVAPILVLVLSTYDYITAVASKDADGLKKANTRMIKRLVLIVFLVFLPTLVEIFLALLVGADVSTCIS